MHRSVVFPAISSAILIFSGSAWGQDDARAPYGSNGVVQVGAGVLLPGEVWIEDTAFDTGAGPVIHVAIDGLVAPKFSMGVFAFRAATELTETDVDATITTVGMTLKGRFGQPDHVNLRAGIVFGYQMIEADLEGGDGIRGFDIAPVLELALPSSGSVSGALQATFTSQPVGGNDHVEVTFDPIIMLGGLLEFRF